MRRLAPDLSESEREAVAALIGVRGWPRCERTAAKSPIIGYRSRRIVGSGEQALEEGEKSVRSRQWNAVSPGTAVLWQWKALGAPSTNVSRR